MRTTSFGQQKGCRVGYSNAIELHFDLLSKTQYRKNSKESSPNLEKSCGITNIIKKNVFYANSLFYINTLFRWGCCVYITYCILNSFFSLRFCERYHHTSAIIISLFFSENQAIRWQLNSLKIGNVLIIHLHPKMNNLFYC